MSKSIKAPLVEVTWVDACSTHGWHEEAELAEATTKTMTTVGYMVRRSKRDIALAQVHSAENDQWAEICVIPAAWIKRVRRLR